MNKFILQIAFEKCYQELLLDTQEYVNKFGDYMSPDNSCINSLYCEYEGDTLYAKFPQAKTTEIRNKLVVLTLEHILNIPLFFDPNKGEQIDNPETFVSQRLYQEYITRERKVDPEMHFLIYVSLTDTDAVNNIRKFVSQLPSHLSFGIDVVALTNEISKEYKSESFEIKDFKLMADNLQKIVDLKREIIESNNDDTYVNLAFGNIFFLHNVDEVGHALNFNKEKLTWIFGNLILSLIEGYDSLIDTRVHDYITTFGIETLEVDRYKIINNWSLHILKKLTNRVIRSAAKEDEVDKEKVYRIFSEILKEEKVALEKINNIEEDQVETFLEQWREELKEKIIAKIVSADLNNAERQLLLSYFESVTKRSLSELEDYDISKFDLFDNLYLPFIEQTMEGDNPYSRVKEIILNIQDIKKKIKERQASIEEKRKVIDNNYRHVGKWTEGGFQIGEDVFKFSHKDWNEHNVVDDNELFANYKAQPISSLPKSADLKRFFPDVKNQGSQGACASFSLTAAYEYLLSTETHKNDDLSEAFVYYNARAIRGKTNEDSGVSLDDVLKGMADKGVCLEELCKYDDSVYDKEPSEAAYENGKEHIVTAAKRVPVTVEAVKSAISEGYPVVGSFRVFESLQYNTNGFIPMPTDEERKGAEESFHAMVICGYNDKHAHFIVRNSWGKDFGDNGYCYLPYSYLRDKDLTRYAVAITGINASTFIEHNPVDDDFRYSSKDNNVQYAILLNLLKEEEYRLEEDRDRLKSLVAELRETIEKLKQKEDLKDIPDDANKQYEELSNEIFDLIRQKSEITIGSFKKTHIIHSVIFAVSGGITAYNYLNDNTSVWHLCAILALLSILSWVACVMILRWKGRREFDRRIAELEEKRQAISNLIAKNKIRDRVIKILDVIGDFGGTVNQNRELLDVIIQTLKETDAYIVKYLEQDADNKDEEEQLLYPDWYKEIEGEFEDISLLKRLLLEGKKNDCKEVLRKIQEEILLKLNVLFKKDIKTIYNKGESAEWKHFVDRVYDVKEKVYARIDIAKFLSEGGREKGNQCSYLFSNVDNIDIPDHNEAVIESMSNNRYIYFYLKRVKIDELILLNNKM